MESIFENKKDILMRRKDREKKYTHFALCRVFKEKRVIVFDQTPAEQNILNMLDTGHGEADKNIPLFYRYYT
jgi:hypothetical protein